MDQHKRALRNVIARNPKLRADAREHIRGCFLCTLIQTVGVRRLVLEFRAMEAKAAKRRTKTKKSPTRKTE